MTTTHTTARLQLPPRARLRAWLAQRDPLVVIASAVLPLVALLLIGALWRAQRLAQTTAAAPAPITIIATPRQEAVPTAAPAIAAVQQQPLNVLRGAVVAYDSPNGNVLGAIEAGRAYELLARFGADWLQADVAGSGVVWLKAAEVLSLPAGLADMQPPPAPVIIERPVYVSAPAPAPAPAVPAPDQQYTVANEPPIAPAAPSLPEQPAIAVERAPAPAAPQTAATPSLEEAIAATNADVQAAPNGGTQWRLEHCVGDVCH